MWLTADGGMHTTAVPDPRTVVVLELATGHPLGRLPEAHLARLQTAIEELIERCYAEAATLVFDAATEAPFVSEVPDRVRVVLGGATAEEQATSLTQQVEALPFRWRLDRLTALEDLLDEVH